MGVLSLLKRQGKTAAAIGIIGGADGPTAIWLVSPASNAELAGNIIVSVVAGGLALLSAVAAKR